MCFKAVNSDLFDELEVEDELYNYPTITVYDKISGNFIIFREDDYEDYEGPDLIAVNDENMQIINQLIFNQLKENSNSKMMSLLISVVYYNVLKLMKGMKLKNSKMMKIINFDVSFENKMISKIILFSLIKCLRILLQCPKIISWKCPGQKVARWE